MFLVSLGIEFHTMAPKHLSKFFPFKTALTFGIIILALNGENNCLLLQVNYLRCYKFRLPKIGRFNGELQTNYLYLVNPENMTLNHYTLMKPVNFMVCPSFVKHPYQWTILNCDSMKGLNKVRRFSKET